MKHNSLLIALFCCLGARFGFAAEPPPPPLPPVPAEEVEKIRAAIPSKAEVATPKQPRKLLVFYRSHNPGIHPMAHGNKMFELLAEKTGAFTVTLSQDYADLSADRLKQYDAVFMNNAGMLKFEGFPERQGLLEFVRGGKGLAGQHWATDNFRDWPEAAEHLFGAVMNGHPFFSAQVRNEVQSSPMTAMFPPGGFPWNEEYYIFSKKDHRSEPRFKQTYDRSKLRVLLSIDVEKSPAVQKTIAEIAQNPKSMYYGKLCEDNDYALSWIRREGEGRVFYTAFGHHKSVYWNPVMVRHFMAGVQYALGDLPADDSPSQMAITDMRTEGVCQPMGIEEAAPRFSWRYAAGADAPRGFRQSAFTIQVASSLEKLAQGQADLWDSGKQAGADTLSAIYAGKPLASATRYFWKVTGFDAAGKAYSSAPQFFEMGLLKAEDWGGAQWIGARKERLKTIPANLQGLKDYSFETKFRILEGSATFQFRAAYAWQKGYGIKIEPGTPGKFIVTCKKGDNKNEVLKEYPVPKCATNEWHTLQVTLKGADFWFRVNDQPLNDEPLHDETSKEGTLSMGAFSADRKRGLAQFDDFKLTVNGEVFVQENFDNPAMFAFQDCVFSNNFYSRVKDGVMEVSIINVFLDPKEGLAAPLFRKPFAIQPKKIIRARAYVAGLGYYTFWLNGKRLDDYLLQPGFAHYRKTAYYTVYDLTAHVERENILAFELGRGWYGITTPTLWGETFSRDWMAEPALRTLVAIDYADGTRQVVVSDPSFKTAPGPILADSVKAGEIYDARKELPGWNSVRFDDTNWSPAVIASGNMPSSAPGLTAQLFEPIRIVESLAPISIEKIENEADAWLVDFGTNMAGTVELKLRGEPGQRIRISYLEKISPDGWRGRWNNFGAQDTGSFQMDIFLAKGGAEESFQARYSYKGFRYLRVEGFKDKPSPSQFTAKVFNSDMADVGEFRSSSELWNKIWEAGRRCIQSNMHSIPTDCPQWEKLGWTCDDASPYYAMAFNYDLRKLYEKRLQDYADDISADGKIRNCIPGSWAKGEDPAWVGSYVNLTWKHYQTYGDRRMIERHFDNLKLYMSTLIKEGQGSEKPPLLTKPRKALGDWVHPDGGNIPPEGALIYHNLFFFKYARQMAELAKVIGRAEDEKFYATLAADLEKRFNEHHFDEKDGFYYSTNRAPGLRQSPQAIALTLGLVPEDKISGLVDRLVEDIQQRRKGHFWVGILGMEAIADALCENRRADVAYAAHLRDVGPSLGNMIREGATTLWEDYSIRNARSLNHKMFATPLGWMARYVAGLHVEGVLGEGPGFRKAVIAPYPVPEQIKFAQLDYDSPMGRYHSGWRVTDNGMAYDIVVPPNATALFRLPLLGKKDAIVSEAGKILWQNGKPVGSVDGVSTPAQENDRLVFTLGSGSYSFQVKGN